MKSTRPLSEQSGNWMLWPIPVILTPGRWKQEDQEAGGEDRVLQTRKVQQLVGYLASWRSDVGCLSVCYEYVSLSGCLISGCGDWRAERNHESWRKLSIYRGQPGPL